MESSLPDDPSVELLCSIPGIGRLTAVQLMSMIVDVNRFSDGEHMCSYFGLVPRVRDSGGTVRHGHMTKAGDPMIRAVLERVVISHNIWCDSNVTDFYRRKCAGSGKGMALRSSSRKMLLVIYAVLDRGTPFVASRKTVPIIGSD